LNTLILDQAKKLELVIEQIDSIVRKVIIADQKWIAEANRKQLLQGKKATGQDMPEYIPTSSKSGLIKLFDEGLFHEGIEPLFDDQGIEMVGTDNKTGFLVGRYGEIMGLTPDNIRILQSRAIPKIMIQIQAILHNR
jgi:hypothetical protein